MKMPVVWRQENCFAFLFFYGNRMIKFRWFYPASDLPKDGFAVANL